MRRTDPAGGEIHESIITRGMLGDKDKLHLILVPENSNLVHSACHPESSKGSETNFKKCCADLKLNEGDKVLAWLEGVENEVPIIVALVRREYLTRINL